MVTKTVRKIVRIDEEKCNGCGACVISCAEGALQIIDGKARLISETYCDGLGACLGKCPQDAITVEERVAGEFDEAAVEARAAAAKAAVAKPRFSCPSAAIKQFDRKGGTSSPPSRVEETVTESGLTHWPVQLALVLPAAPFLKAADLVLAADCVPFAYAGFHRDFLGGNTALLVACPKLDDYAAHQQKLTEILRQAGISSLTVLHMEVPCCSGLVHMAKQAILASGNVVPFREITFGVQGDRKAG
jgi:Pyruvate/2-oxoacid:ferredoxin oxidoreductase delta subunit